MYHAPSSDFSSLTFPTVTRYGSFKSLARIPDPGLALKTALKAWAILLGVKSGVLPVTRAISLWRQYVEPAALLRAGLTLADVGSDTAMVQLLLGSMPITAAAALRENTAVHRDILRASSKYIKCVYDARWKYGHMLNK